MILIFHTPNRIYAVSCLLNPSSFSSNDSCFEIHNVLERCMCQIGGVISDD